VKDSLDLCSESSVDKLRAAACSTVQRLVQESGGVPSQRLDTLRAAIESVAAQATFNQVINQIPDDTPIPLHTVMNKKAPGKKSKRIEQYTKALTIFGDTGAPCTVIATTVERDSRGNFTGIQSAQRVLIQPRDEDFPSAIIHLLEDDWRSATSYQSIEEAKRGAFATLKGAHIGCRIPDCHNPANVVVNSSLSLCSTCNASPATPAKLEFVGLSNNKVDKQKNTTAIQVWKAAQSHKEEWTFKLMLEKYSTLEKAVAGFEIVPDIGETDKTEKDLIFKISNPQSGSCTKCEKKDLFVVENGSDLWCLDCDIKHQIQAKKNTT
jgi:hypothetical protein